eukprot:m51a1_g3801 putative pseudouridine-5 -phosphate glycosidase-like (577) ;mRNA; f:211573-214100
MARDGCGGNCTVSALLFLYVALLGLWLHHVSCPTSAPASAPAGVVVSPEVARALAEGRAVVALESTIVAHGMPYPQNLQTALDVERAVRDAGAVPATIAVIAGVVRVGLGSDELERLARGGRDVPKATTRDVAALVAAGSDGATTVASTSWAAHAAGIDVFVTGGVGGVHRGVEETMDVSADLVQMGKTPLCVVSAGVKSLLDIGRTLEFLETQGVTVAAYGTDEFPAFFTRKSGFKAPMRVDTPEQVAKIIDASIKLGMPSGMLVAVPIPQEHEARGAEVEAAIQQALAEVKSHKIVGREVTPFILKRVAELTKGESLASNIALVKNNANIGARIAVALAEIRKASAASAASSWIGRTLGSMCQCEWPLESLFAEAEELSASEGTSEDPNCGSNPVVVLGVSDTHILKKVLPSSIQDFERSVSQAKIAVLDGNFGPETSKSFVEMASKHSVPVWFEPTSVAKCVGPIAAGFISKLTWVSPNQDELVAMSAALGHPKLSEAPSVDDVRAMIVTLQKAGVRNVLAKLGARGVIVGLEGQSASQFVFLSPPKPREIVNVAGAGDSLVGASLSARLRPQ